MANLPEWLNTLIPEITLPVVLKFSNDKYYAHYPEGQSYPDSTLSKPFDSFDEAYNSVSVESGFGVTFDSSLPENEHLLFDGLITVPDDSGNSRAYISSTEQSHLEILENAYNKWLTTVADEYLKHPSSFLKAYYFVDNHPCFWTRTMHPKENGWHDSWITSGHAQRLSQFVGYSEESPTGVSFNIEAGPHISPEYVHHSHDLRLEVYGHSYEDAIVKLAAKIHKFYNLDGTAREDVEYEPSPLEKLLVERLEASNSRRAQNDNSTSEFH